MRACLEDSRNGNVIEKIKLDRHEGYKERDEKELFLCDFANS